ncbi:hypothetical protein RRG08_027170 [Elysia crispata]|uniref:Uncharacterized protein n=1 Tax=Elysia crispata TaxID=231223 RepID=A0AAE1E9T0_9GAST|nr:hypothetical protein RRG08_027170 [Elysia crispata]
MAQPQVALPSVATELSFCALNIRRPAAFQAKCGDLTPAYQIPVIGTNRKPVVTELAEQLNLLQTVTE